MFNDPSLFYLIRSKNVHKGMTKEEKAEIARLLDIFGKCEVCSNNLVGPRNSSSNLENWLRFTANPGGFVRTNRWQWGYPYSCCKSRCCKHNEKSKLLAVIQEMIKMYKHPQFINIMICYMRGVSIINIKGVHSMVATTENLQFFAVQISDYWYALWFFLSK